MIISDVLIYFFVCMFYVFFFFFFSSRRRHTRSYGDWSSDVCSSDLRPLRPLRDIGVRVLRHDRGRGGRRLPARSLAPHGTLRRDPVHPSRRGGRDRKSVV